MEKAILKLIGQIYEAFRDNWYKELWNSFFAVSSQLLLLSLSLKIVRNSLLAWSLILDCILLNMNARG